MRRPQIAVVGYGYWGPNFARNLDEVDGCDLVCIADEDAERRELAQRRHPRVRVLSGLQEVLALPDVEAVVLTTPVSTHYEMAQKVLQDGRHVLVSKPLTNSVRAAEDLVSLASETNRVLMVDHTFVYTGAVQKMAELAGSGDLGDIYYFDSIRMNLGLLQADVGVLWDLAPHDLSIVRHVLGVMPESVLAVGGRRVGATCEFAHLLLRYPDGLLGHVQASWLAPAKVRNTTFVGSQKMVVYDDNEVAEKVKVFDRGVDIRHDPEGVARARVEYRAGDVWAPRLDSTEALRAECAHFVDCIVDGKQPLTDGQAGLDVVRVLEAAETSLAEGGREVRV